MANYSSVSAQPWYSYRKSITEVSLSEGITHIGKRVFREFTTLTEIVIPDGVTETAAWALTAKMAA